jgi:hypothetical protein
VALEEGGGQREQQMERKSMSEHESLLSDVIEALEQGATLIAAIPDEVYAGAPVVLPCASTVGAHYRHVLEHVQLLLDGLGDVMVDYDLRRRDPRVEVDRDVAMSLTRRLCGGLRGLPLEQMEAPILIAHATCPTGDPHKVPSTTARELMFILSHTIHHWALVRMLVELHQHEAPATFGYMPSTLRHMQASASG